MKEVFQTDLEELRRRHVDPELQIKELFRNYNVSLELIKHTDDHHQLLDRILEEYGKRLDEIPGIDLVNLDKQEALWREREKLRSLILFASQAVALKEKADLFRKLEEQNRKLNELTQKLERKNRKLKAVNQQYLNMLGFVSHELRSPLISILGFAELLNEGVLGRLNEEQSKAANVIIRSSNTLIEMIQNYLDLAKIEQGEIKVEKHSVNLVEDVLFPLVEEMEEQFQKKEMTVYMEGEDKLTSLVCDPKLMRIVLGNLLSNAVKYGEDGGYLCVELIRKDDFLRISVANSGQGVPRKELKRIFQKFSQGDDRRERSSGLGLYNARYLVKRQGGKIWAESEPGSWFKVIVEMPV